MRRLTLFALLLVGCGGSPTTPSVPAVTVPAAVTVTARDGITGEVVNASVQQSGGMVNVTAPGFLTRSQPMAANIYLWKQPEAYVGEIVFARSYAPRSMLQRWPTGAAIRMAFGAGLGRYDAMLADHAAKLAEATRLSVIALPAGSSGANVNLSVEPFLVPNRAIAATHLTLSSGVISSARVAFESEAMITTGGGYNNTLLHELGHVVGLAHSPDRTDVMSIAANAISDREFGDSERRALTMMYSWRKAGNTFPDSEPQGLASGRPQTYTIACR